MKYIAEQERKFTDMGGVQIYHSIYPVRYSQPDKAWGPVIRFDNKVLLAGRSDVQHIIGCPIQIIRIAINGSADYYDSWGYRTVLGEQDTLAVQSGREVLSAVLQNNDDQANTELLEIWLKSNNEEQGYEFHSGPASRDKGRFYTLVSTNDPEENNQQQQKKWLRIGSFNAGVSQNLTDIAVGHRVILFVFNGEVTANGQQLNYRDTAIFSVEGNIALEFRKDTNLFVMEIGKEEVSS
jgi:redox-sensitive bicupin YhaK (pirin superfamily)